METIKIDRDQLVHASPERLKDILAAHGIENGEVIKIELMGDNAILFVAVHSYSSSSAAIEEVDGVLLARTSIVGNPDSVVQADRDERLFSSNELVKALFDTSVLIAAFVTEHPKHSASLPYLQKVRNEEIDGYICAHCIAELYAVLTGRTSPRILPADAQNIMIIDLPRFQVVDLGGSDYLTVIDRMVILGLSGGVIYDALHAYAAHKIEADAILTLNPNDFNRLGLAVAEKWSCLELRQYIYPTNRPSPASFRSKLTTRSYKGLRALAEVQED